ncbi:MAG: hypothetical protein KAR38_15525 [Calditrichia bacterium]|nr:hypothetical protein [Calditrichia bacterium]
MRRIFLILIIIMISSTMIFSQNFGNPLPEEDQSSLAGGLGFTWIDGQPYTTFTITPDLSFGKIGVGLNIQLLMDNNNSFEFRKEEYEGGAGWLRAVRYVRYGHKSDPFYGRVGTLDAATLGHGFLVWNYTNGSNYDKRKVGLALDIDFKKAGFESMFSNLGDKELMGARAYVRPVRFYNPDMFLLNNLRFGFSLVKDFDLYSWKEAGEKEGLTAFGLDVDIPVINKDWVKSYLYFDYAKFNDFGSGRAVGINFMLPNFIGVLGVGASFERRWLGDEFIANFFGPMYDMHRELDPFEYGESSMFFELSNAKKSQGYFGQLAAHITSKVRVIGNYQKLDDDPESGMFHAEALAPDLIPKFKLKAYYDKRHIKTFKDLRTLDFNSLAAAEVGYMLNSFIMVSTLYKWYWVKAEDGSYKPRERVEPRISFVYNF